MLAVLHRPLSQSGRTRHCGMHHVHEATGRPKNCSLWGGGGLTWALSGGGLRRLGKRASVLAGLFYFGDICW